LADVTGQFDLVTMHQNIYYFEEDERAALFARVRSWLAPGGRLALTSFMQGRTPASINFDIALRCTVGCTALPTVDEVVASLKGAGFARVESAQLMPLEPLYGIIAS
jgi:cyclopropane fatty-acyl-phospholipid synthase-like methyltransferase